MKICGDDLVILFSYFIGLFLVLGISSEYEELL